MASGSGSNGKSKKKLGDAELWDKLQSDAELERIKHLTPAQVSAEIRADGGDPDAIGRRGAALAARLLPQRGTEWTARATSRREAIVRRVGDWPNFASLPRTELRARIHAARSDARFTAPVVAAFRKRGEEDSSDDELRALLEEIEVLRRLHADEDE